MKKVLVFGTFDKLHKGHRYLLKEAKKHGDFLVVIIARDKTVKEIKGKYPRYNDTERIKAVKKLNFVDKVLLGSERDKFKVIEKVRPDIICLGYDQIHFTKDLDKILKRMGIKCKVIRLEAYKPYRFKSSLIK